MAAFIIFSLGFINAILCYESGSSELNRIEFTPLYETIIYSDIADIIKDYENNALSPMEALTNNDDNSESDENIEDLLSEYQHYLNKAHKQRRNYLDKSKTKNKVPLLQRDRYSKSLAAKTNKHDDYYYNPGTLPFPKSKFNAPLDFLIPINMVRPNSFSDPFKPQLDPAKLFPFDNTNPEAKRLQLPPVMPSSIHDSIPSSCYCEADTFPCECGCKQCLMEPIARKKLLEDEKANPKAGDGPSKDERAIADNTLNIKIKVDIQFPQVPLNVGEVMKNKSYEKIEHGSISKESNINVPFPLFNFPFPLEMYGLKKQNKDTPIHKITIHRKKKSKGGSIGRRHRKKVITFHDIKVEQHHSTLPSLDENNNTSEYRPKTESNFQVSQAIDLSNLTQKSEQENTLYTEGMLNKTSKLAFTNDTKHDGGIHLPVNLKNSFDNNTEDVHRNENSIETDNPRGIINKSTEEPSLRKKRQVSSQNNSATENPEPKNVSLIHIVSAKPGDIMKKSDKSLPDDMELLYWPNNSNGQSLINSRNITSLILERENNKEKLNLSTEMIRHNRSKALEEAIFGKVDWNDVGTVAPVFMSFMGKYIRGALSFCSDSTCHSMKCAEKMCVHRTCAPADRTNNRGHCAGSNTTDSVVSMESIMDLPSNIALEIVDILQQKMIGKLFGKATISIGSKCVTFMVSKKNFVKVKCTPKELDATGHCAIAKNTKVA